MKIKEKEEVDTIESSQGLKANIFVLRRLDDLPPWLTIKSLSRFVYENIKPYEDTLEDTRRAVEMALDPDRPEGAFILVAEKDRNPVGALIMLRTGMKGYVPENILLMVCVHPSMRGKGVGGQLIRKGIDTADGDVKLHVEYDNPARKVYEKIGFTSKYAEMRYIK